MSRSQHFQAAQFPPSLKRRGEHCGDGSILLSPSCRDQIPLRDGWLLDYWVDVRLLALGGLNRRVVGLSAGFTLIFRSPPGLLAAGGLDQGRVRMRPLGL